MHNRDICFLNTKFALCILLIFVSAACQQRSKEISFYYWRTRFHLDKSEAGAIVKNNVKTLHVRYFDVEWNQMAAGAVPVQSVSFDTSGIKNIQIIPVVYITNQVFDLIQQDSISDLANSVYHLISDISRSQQIITPEIQFDCDWTENTKGRFFTFLKDYKRVSNTNISCTIRLHQIKYPGRMGIPPVDYGVLMFYNMGKIAGDASNSIYENYLAENYIPAIQTYPLSLDIALPIFSWSLQIRQGQVIHLLNKMSFSDFENLPNFRKTQENRYEVERSCFMRGYYFMQSDEVKVEYISAGNLKEMVRQVNKYTNHKIRNLIFYDLDTKNLKLYESKIFKEIADRID